MPDSMPVRIATLQQMTTAQLREEWRRVIGGEPRSYNRAWLWKRLAWAIQAREFGGLSAAAQARLEELLPYAGIWMPLGRRAFPPAAAPAGSGDARLPKPGDVLTRAYKGRTVAVLVKDDGRFEHDGRIYDSLTAVATAITGSHWSGAHFFGLRPARRRV